MRLPSLVAALLLAAPVHAEDLRDDKAADGDSEHASDQQHAGDDEHEDKLTAKDLERRRIAAQAAKEEAQPRPPLPDYRDEPDAPEWTRHIEIGGDFAFVVRPFAGAESDSGTSYDPAPAWGLHVRWPVVSWLRVHAYFIDARHNVVIPPGALVAPTDTSISPQATFDELTVTTFVFGARIAPTLEFTDRLRAWIGGGIGWGRFEFPRVNVTEADGSVFEVGMRAGSFVEFPFSIGASWDVIDRWLAIEIEGTFAPVTGQSGSAHTTHQTVDANGRIVHIGGFGAIEASFVQTLGLSLIL